jgi:Septum formation
VHPRLAAVVVVLAVVLSACGQSSGSEPEESGTANRPPELGACRVLAPDDITQHTNDTETVPCTEKHTAETFAVGSFPTDVAKSAELGDPRLGRYIYETCSDRFQRFLGGDESTVMRSMLTWAWFRPSQDEWDAGARWYRCDVVGGADDAEELRTLPTTAKGLLGGPPNDTWMTCAVGETVSGSEKVPCSQPHNWRAVTTIKVGGEQDDYPGDRVVEARTRDYCSDSVGAWMNYPVDYEFGYTYFRQAEWKAGNRRSICWARTDQ